MTMLYDVWPKPCSKKSYGSEEHAEGVAGRRQEKEGYQLYIYRCPTCLLWHITKHPQDYVHQKSKPKAVRSGRFA